MEKRKRGLGRGIYALLSDTENNINNEEKKPEHYEIIPNHTLLQVETSMLSPNPHQARKNFDEEKIEELSISIEKQGILQPLIITKHTDNEEKKYTIVAGERRWRAARKKGLKRVPAIFIELDTLKNIEASLTENIQRENLTPIELAKALKTLSDVGNLTQEELAKKLGLSRPVITNCIRLLSLPDYIQDAIETHTISQSHARLLLQLLPSEQKKAFEKIVSSSLNIRETEELIQAMRQAGRSKKKALSPKKKADPHIKMLEQNFVEKFGTQVVFSGSQEKGVISFHYYNEEDLSRLLEIFGVSLS